MEEKSVITKNNFYSQVLTTLPEAFIIHRKGAIIFASDHIKKLSGYEPHEVIGSNITFFLSSESKKNFENFFKKKSSFGHDGIEIEIISKDNNPKYVNARSSFIIYNGQKSIVSVITDISERKNIESILKYSEHKFKSIFDGANDAIFTIETETGIIIDANKKAETLLKTSKAELIGLHYSRLHPKNEFVSYVNDLETDMLNATPIYLNLIDKDMLKTPVELSASIIKLAPTLKLFHGIYRDISERKKAEASLIESESRYRTLVETIPNGLVELDISATITYLNASFCKIYGYSKEELVGSTLWDIIIDSEQSKVQKIFISLLRGTSKTFPIIFKGRRKDGILIDVQLDWNYKRDENGRVAGFIAIIADITEKLTTELELKNAKEAAEEANRAKSEFLANMSHEIRTPMNGIIGMTHLLYNTELNGQQHEFLELIKLSADNLLALINDILDFSKIEAKKLELEKIDFLLRDSVNHTVKALMYKVMQKGLKVYVDVNPSVPNSLVGDPGRFRQIITNLLSNAIKFTEKGEINVRADLETKTDDTVTLLFSVSDTGIGIPQEKQAAIFEAFTQADSSIARKYEGTGLGLTISRQLVELMNGKIWLESEHGSGSIFYFTAKFGISKSGRKFSLARLEKLRGVKVLVVDDNSTNRKFLEGLLKNWMLDATFAENAFVALDMVDESLKTGKLFEIMLIDINMPEMDGWKFSEKIRAISKYKNARIIIMPSAGLRGDIEQSIRLGISAYLIKPVIAGELEEALLMIVSDTAQTNAKLITQHSIRENKQRLNILLAEDEIVNQKIATKLLEMHGHAVSVAHNGRQAFDLVRNEKFDMIFMDVQMPEMDGLEATCKIRELEKDSGRHIPIVAMTAFAMKGDRERCLNAGMDAYISKPLEIEEIFSVIDGLFFSAGSERSLTKHETRRQMQPSFDEAAFISSQKGDIKFSIELVETFMQTVSNYLADIKNAVEKYDSRSLKKAAHTLKGSVKNFHADFASDMAHAIELMAISENYAEIDLAILRLNSEIEHLKTDMLSFIRRHKNSEK